MEEETQCGGSRQGLNWQEARQSLQERLQAGGPQVLPGPWDWEETPFERGEGRQDGPPSCHFSCRAPSWGEGQASASGSLESRTGAQHCCTPLAVRGRVHVSWRLSLEERELGGWGAVSGVAAGPLVLHVLPRLLPLWEPPQPTNFLFPSTSSCALGELTATYCPVSAPGAVPGQPGPSSQLPLGPAPPRAASPSPIRGSGGTCVCAALGPSVCNQSPE